MMGPRRGLRIDLAEPLGKGSAGRAHDLMVAAQSDAGVLVVAAEAGRRHYFARLIHRRGLRRAGTWLATDGAAEDLAALFERAGGGTLFLDGVAALTTSQQRRLLRLLDGRDGFGMAPVPPHRTRLIVGAGPEIFAAVRARAFSERLFYRLNVIRIDDGTSASLEESTMTVRDLMSTPPHTCQPETNLAAVTQTMWDRDCGFVPVVDQEGHLAGVLTDRDICVAAATRRLVPERISAAQAMSTDVHACLPDDSLDEAIATMKKFQIRRLPVVDGNGHLQGVLSMNDVARAAGKKGGPSAADVVATLAAICAPRAVEVAVA